MSTNISSKERELRLARSRQARRNPLQTAGKPKIDHAAETRIVRKLWEEQHALIAENGGQGANMEYLNSHFAMDLTLWRHLVVLDWITPWIRGKVLEWGCQHALDSCIYRIRFGETIDLFGCDIVPPGAYLPFHQFSGLKYTELHHPYLLPYEDAQFDVVTSNGVLEHVPQDVESIGEVHRVLKPGGMFVITCLPNLASYTEAIQRHRGGTAHDRLYTVKSTRKMLNQAGFDVLDHAYYFLLPTMLNGFSPRIKSAYQRAHRIVRTANSVLERLWPINRIASNLMLLARKR